MLCKWQYQKRRPKTPLKDEDLKNEDLENEDPLENKDPRENAIDA